MRNRIFEFTAWPAHLWLKLCAWLVGAEIDWGHDEEPVYHIDVLRNHRDLHDVVQRYLGAEAGTTRAEAYKEMVTISRTIEEAKNE